MDRNIRFKKKYLKYKSKYLNIKKLIGGSFGTPVTPPLQITTRLPTTPGPPFQGTYSPVQNTVINHYMKVSPDQTPFKPSEKINVCTSRNPIRCLKYYTDQVISKIIRRENEGNAFIADVIHDMETSGRKQKIINGSFGDYVSSSIPGIYNSKSYFDKLLIGNNPELLRAHNKAFFHSRKPKKNDDETYREDHENNLSFAQKEYNTLTSEELDRAVSVGDINYIPAPVNKRDPITAIMTNDFYNKIIDKFSDNKVDLEAENSPFSIPKLFTDPSIIDTGLYLKCEPIREPPKDIKEDIVMIDQGSNSSSLTSQNFNAIDGKDFILDGLKPFNSKVIRNNLKTNIVINDIIENLEEKELKELFEHITDSYFKHIFDILNLGERLNLRDSKIKIIDDLWFLNFRLGEKNYLIDITNRGITRHTYNLSSLVISEYENNGDPLEWKYLKDIRDDYNILYDNILYDNLVLFCNIVCLTAKAFGDASYKIFTYLITIFKKYHIEQNGNPTIVTQDRQLLYDLVKTSIIGLDDYVALLPNIYYKLKSKKKKEGLIIATNTSSLPEYDFEYVKISLDYINNFISLHGESTNELVNSGSFNNYIVLLILKLCFINEKKFIDLIEKYISDTSNLKIFENIPIVFILSKVREFDNKATELLLNELENKHRFLTDVINFRFIFNKNPFYYDNFFKNIEILFNKFKKGKFLFKIKDILDLTPTYYSFENIYQDSFTQNENKSNLLIFIYEQPVHNFDNIQSISEQITGDKSINYLDAYLNILPRIGLVQDEIPNIVDYFLENIYLAQIKFDKEKELYDDLKETNIYVWRVFLINLILFDNREWGTRSSKIRTLYNILHIFITSYNGTISEQYTDPEINLLNINLVENEEDIYIDDGLRIKKHAELFYSNTERVGVSNRRLTPAVSVNAGKLINEILKSKEPLIKGFIRILSNIELPTAGEVDSEARPDMTVPNLNEDDYERMYNCLIEKYINIEDKTLLEFKLKFMPSIITKIMKMKGKITDLKKDLFHERGEERSILPNEAWFRARYQEKNDKDLSINDIVGLIRKWIVLFSPDHEKGVATENELFLCFRTRK